MLTAEEDPEASAAKETLARFRLADDSSPAALAVDEAVAGGGLGLEADPGFLGWLITGAP